MSAARQVITDEMKEIASESRSRELINQLLEVWESSVRATHDFLSSGENLEIKRHVPEALNTVRT